MSVEAVGTYLRVLMEKRGLTALAVTQAAGVHPNYIWRLEKGEIKRPAMDVITELVYAVRGCLEEVGVLIRDKQATPQDGYNYALNTLAAEIETEGELEKLIADWQADARIRRSIRSAWLIARAAARATGAANR